MEPAEASTHNSRRAGSVPGPRSGPRTRRAGSPSALPGYAELHCKTNFSFLEGASHAQELVERAAELGYAALAVTDRDTLAGVVRAHAAARAHGLPLIIGAEITLQDAPPVVLWAPDRAAYGRLARLITLGRRRAGKGACALRFDDLAQHAQGLLAGLVATAQWEPGPAPDRGAALAAAPATTWRDALSQFRDLFGDRGYLLAAFHRGPDDQRQLDELLSQSRRSRLPLVASGNVLYHARERLPLQDVLTAIRHGLTVAEAGDRLQPNAERHLHTREAMRATFSRVPAALQRTLEIASRCQFSLDELRYEYPAELAPAGRTPFEYLQQLTWQGACQRYPAGVPDKVRRLLEHELALIRELHYEPYFLTVWDLVRLARHRHILCQGRGSAANSAVCYCLGITSVDPEQMDVLFERFVSRERQEAPDIDVDFEHERREEVLQYLYSKYGRERAGMTGVVITYRTRSAIRDVGKALGLSLDCVDALARQVDGHADDAHLAERCRQVGLDPASETGRRLVYLVTELTGFPRHLSQHVGGMVITQGPLCELVPIENAAMAGRTVIQWDKDDLDTLGLLKVDCLALGMLTAIHRCFDLIHQHTGRPVTLARIPAGDARVYDMICRADTMGVFQIESRAQMSMLPRLKPRCFYDLVIEVAIVRPGPIQGDMVHPYLRRRNGEEAVTYPSPAIREVLEKTLGVPLFQEQAMRLAVVAAGFTPGEADQLRRAMGAWRRPGVIDQFRKKLIDGMRAHGLAPEYAEAVFRQIRGFGEYGFPESHAASFALLVYVSAWLKCHHPAAFTASLLNSQPMGFYGPAQLVRNAREHGVEVRAVDVNHSRWDCTLEGNIEYRRSNIKYHIEEEPTCQTEDHSRDASGNVEDAVLPSSLSPSHSPALRLGLRTVHGFSETHADQIEAARAAGRFRSVDDFARRTGLSRAVIVRLAKAGAFDSLGLDRRGAMWHALAQGTKQEQLPLFDDEEDRNLQSDISASLPPMSPAQEVLADYRATGLSLRAHPMSFLRTGLGAMDVVPSKRLATWPNGKPVRVAGVVLVRQRPGTAKGITFVTLEDETGVANLIIRPDVWKKFRAAALGATVLLAHGRLQREGLVIHVLVSRLEDLSARMQDLTSQSRDFS